MTVSLEARRRERAFSHLRWWIIIVACAGNTINYLDRANLSVAMPFMTRDLHLGTVESGYALSAFYFTYAPALVLLGYLVDRFGARVIGSVAVGLWSVFSGLTGLAQGGAMLIGFRLMLGLGESGAYPSWVKALSEWFPKQERAFGTIIYDNGARIGSTLAFPVIAGLIALAGWRASFLATAALALIWIPLWIWLYRRPRRHPRVSQSELDHIESGGARQEAVEDVGHVRWIDLLRYRTTWGMVLGLFGNGAAGAFFAWFPTYLVEVHHFSLLKLGLFGAIPGLAALAGGYAGGLISDWLVRRGVSVNAARKSCIAIGSLASTVVALAAFTDSAMVALILLAVFQGCLVFANGSIWALPADIAPTPGRVSSLAMIMDFGGMMGALLFPIAIGYMVALGGGSFELPLLTAAGLAVLSTIGFCLIVRRVEPLPAPRRSTPSATV